ncbi:hypothetical protein [Carnobacterium maltaromaticum]|uniref:hypothetical protein n=1 Tax=Carnobacterium maltaromaticum TaxID=2751 RepID=UPI0039AF6CBB
MSKSSLWIVDKEYKGSEIFYYQNSWLLTPVAGQILFEKYLPEKVITSYGKMSFLAIVGSGNGAFNELNKRINESAVLEDRIIWELIMQQTFRIQDKGVVSSALKNFLTINNYSENGEAEHIVKRFEEVAGNIEQLDVDNVQFFIFKNTSTDDGVESIFQKFDENLEEYVSLKFNEIEEFYSEIVIIEEGKISGFVKNNEYFN